MSQILQLFILIPLISFGLSLLLPRKKERPIANLAIGSIVLYLIALTGFIVYWLADGYPTLDIKHIVFFKSETIEIFIDYYFDKVAAVYSFVGATIILLVAIFSRYYIHREEGFKRFFNTLLLFFTGYNLVIFAGNYETLFIGWELLGICSFLLIAFYRDRYLPVKNAMKVISIYRLSDICLILAMWMSHHLWHENVTFVKLNDTTLIQGHLSEHGGYAVFVAIMILIASAVKSAQLPFSSWLPRAMEGPTTSTAIFYGSLSVHIGVFILLRTYPYWESMMHIKVLIIAIGVATSFVGASIAGVQSSVKTQIAYSSLTQIGLIFIEVALGFHTFALIHFAGNAFLRTYQLLVSPSVLSYEIHDMVFNFKPHKHNNDNTFINRIKSSLYILSTKEYNMDTTLHSLLWKPFKWIGRTSHFVTSKMSMAILALLLLAGIYISAYPGSMGENVSAYLPLVFSVPGFLLVMSSFTQRAAATKSWILVVAGQLFITLSITLSHKDFGLNYVLIYLSGIILSSIVGYVCLSKIKQKEQDINLDRFHGHIHEYKVLAFIFLVACLALVGLPFTPTFIGMDLLFSHIHKQDLPLIILTSLSFVFIEISVLRIYSRIFLGQHKKAYHPIAYRSS